MGECLGANTSPYAPPERRGESRIRPLCPIRPYAQKLRLGVGCEPKCDFSQAPTGGRGSCRAEKTWVIAGKEYTGLRGHFVRIQGAITGA